MNAEHEQWKVKGRTMQQLKISGRETIRRNQMAQRPTVTQMSRKFKVTHLQPDWVQMGRSVNYLMSYASPESLILSPGFFYKASFISLYVS